LQVVFSKRLNKQCTHIHSEVTGRSMSNIKELQKWRFNKKYDFLFININRKSRCVIRKSVLNKRLCSLIQFECTRLHAALFRSVRSAWFHLTQFKNALHVKYWRDEDRSCVLHSANRMTEQEIITVSLIPVEGNEKLFDIKHSS